MCVVNRICFTLARHFVRVPFSLALLSAGSNMAARIAMMAMTTSNSIKVNARSRPARPKIFDSDKFISSRDNSARINRDSHAVSKALFQSTFELLSWSLRFSLEFDCFPIGVARCAVRHQHTLVKSQMHSLTGYGTQIDFQVLPIASPVGAAFNDAFFQQVVVGIDIQFPGAARVRCNLER